MGVPRKENASEFRPIRIEDSENYQNYVNYAPSESDNELNEISRRISVEQLHPIKNKAAKKMRLGGKTARRMLGDDVDNDGVNVKRNMGMRKWRRVEHARIMMSFTDLDDICEDGSDIATPPTTAFDKLFADKENMKLWNQFCEKEETEQLRILNGTSKLQKTPDTPTTSSGAVATTPTSKTSLKKPVRRFSPYSGAACFDRIDFKSRMALLGRKVNWAFIDFLEKELRNVFRIDENNQQDTEAVFIGHYPASSDRLLAHIVAQWLGLSSQSVTDPILKERITEIRNRRPLIPPQTTLIAHMEDRILKRPLDFVPFSMREEDEKDVEDVAVGGEETPEEDEEKDLMNDHDTSFLIDDLADLNVSNSNSTASDSEEWEKVPKEEDF
ncbi:hypothetical protein L5515_015549 [Caenorhabditis briggsae]|uniref:R3H-associated N-terminal domain-containing protein n=2 Tax=Caenorhabditis briggsae TaxID=6238 RepID=A0AAE9EHK6_CAEBR|nr:hypothetical protein L5515_015549 [Caenorhabditis briggsae]